MTVRPDDGMLTHVSHRAMATQFVVILPGANHPGVEAAMEALESVDEIEQRLTVYRPTSQISLINAGAGGNPVRADRKTFSLIQQTLDLCQRTNGALDISIGPLVTAWGFESRSGRKPSINEIDQARQLVGFDKVQLDPSACTVTLPLPGMRLNLGSVGKGAAIDDIKRYLLHAGVENFLIHGGASSVLAHGNQSPEHDRGWAVGIAHPTVANRRVSGTWLKDAAIGTSGSGKQFFHHAGRRFGHVLDPRTGYPIEANNESIPLSITVQCQTATMADAFATAALAGGTDVLPPSAPWLSVHAADRQDDIRVTHSENWVHTDEATAPSSGSDVV